MRKNNQDPKHDGKQVTLPWYKVWKAYMGRMVFRKIASMLYDNSPCHVLPFWVGGKKRTNKLNFNRFHPSLPNLGPANFLDVAFDRNPAMVWEKKTRVGEGSGWNGEMHEECWGNYLGKLAHGHQFACVCLQFLTSLEAIGGLWGNWWKQTCKISSGNIWQPSKKPKKRSTFAYFMVAVHEATVSPVVIYFGK